MVRNLFPGPPSVRQSFAVFSLDCLDARRSLFFCDPIDQTLLWSLYESAYWGGQPVLHGSDAICFRIIANLLSVFNSTCFRKFLSFSKLSLSTTLTSGQPLIQKWAEVLDRWSQWSEKVGSLCRIEHKIWFVLKYFYQLKVGESLIQNRTGKL
jgi:hypothetical protein